MLILLPHVHEHLSELITSNLRRHHQRQMTWIINPGRVILSAPDNRLLRPSQITRHCRFNRVHRSFMKLLITFAEARGGKRGTVHYSTALGDFGTLTVAAAVLVGYNHPGCSDCLDCHVHPDCLGILNQSCLLHNPAHRTRILNRRMVHDHSGRNLNF